MSSSRIVDVADGEADRVALDGFDNLSVSVSFDSTVVSSMIDTDTDRVVAPRETDTRRSTAV